MSGNSDGAPPTLWSLIALSVLGQIVLLPVAAISSFSELMFKMMATAITAYWVLVASIWRRRRNGLSKTDIFLLKWGFYVLFPLVYVVAPAIAMILTGR